MLPEGVAGGLFWLLLPVAAASGWLAARRRFGAGSRRAGAARGISADYFRGLNYLLNEQPDKAIDVLVKLLDVDGANVETHLALGNLYRRRGEVDRAIRIHQNLIAKLAANHEQRSHAVLELAMDYMRSGLLDRAEGLFRELLEQKMNAVEALQHLINIYQQEQDWDKAIETGRQLESVAGRRLDNMIAHFLCEKAEVARVQRDCARARSLVEEALTVDRNCVRASMIAGAVAELEGRLDDAIDAYARVERQDPQFLPEAVPHLVECYRRLGRDGHLQSYLEAIANRQAGITPVLALADLARDRGDLDAAMRHVADELRRRPTVRGLDRFVHLAMHKSDGQTREVLALLNGFTTRLLESKATYRCEDCGFSGRSLHWQCPGCKSWNTVKPIHGIEGE
ncbi:MAG: lipopolysaccharide assembly protein LapB [Gammaproteobacteria bacterium]